MTTLVCNLADVAGHVPEGANLRISAPTIKRIDGTVLYAGGTITRSFTRGRLSVPLVPSGTGTTDPETWSYTFELYWKGGGLPTFSATIEDVPEVQFGALQPVDPDNPEYLPNTIGMGQVTGLPDALEDEAAARDQAVSAINEVLATKLDEAEVAAKIPTVSITASGDTTGAIDSAKVNAVLALGGSVALKAEGSYWLKDIVLRTGTHVYLNGSTVKLPNGANTDIFIGDGFDALAGGTASGGIVRSGVHGPGVIDGNKANQTITGTTIAAGSDGASFPQSTVEVASTAEFPSSGKFTVLTTTGTKTITYTGKTSTSFTGCTGPTTGAMELGSRVMRTGYGIRFYGRNVVLGGGGGPLEVRNCVSDGIWSEWGVDSGASTKPDGAMESDFSSIKVYNNGRNGWTFDGPHDSWIKTLVAYGNAESGMVVTNGALYMQQFHSWGTPQKIGMDIYSETHVLQGAWEVTNVFGSLGFRISGVPVTLRGRVFTPPGTAPTAPNGGNVGFLMRGAPGKYDIDLQVLDCNGAAAVIQTDDGVGRIRLQVGQTNGPGIVRFITQVTSASAGVNVNTLTAGSGVVEVKDTTNWPASGGLMIGTASGPRFATYTGKTATTFTGVTAVGSGVMSAGHTVTGMPVLNGGPTNDLANVNASTDIDLVMAGGTTCPGISTALMNTRQSSAITPSATVSTYGTPMTVNARTRAGLTPLSILGYSATGVSTENLTFKVDAVYSDGSTGSVSLPSASTTISADGGTFEMSLTSLNSLYKTKLTIRSLAVSVRSSKASSTASVTVAVASAT